MKDEQKTKAQLTESVARPEDGRFRHAGGRPVALASRRTRILQKLDLKTTVGLVRYAIKHSLCE